ncbi:hypothetical protein [Pendulispora albinea]|uniref:Uncharacterized protein n=1 Tax=Pendulispora albinea TaxID=2741071 RepID=A0ABZ2M714_9BACT
MKDARFVDEARWIVANERGKAHGEALLGELGDPTVLMAGVLAVLSNNRDMVKVLPETLAEEVTRFVNRLDVRTDSAWFAIAKGLASLGIIGAPSLLRLMESASRLERAPQWVHHTFHEEAFALLRDLDEPTLEAWLALSSAAPTVPIADARVSSAPIEVTRREASWQVSDPFELWDEGGAAIPLVAAYEPLNLLRRFDDRRWFRAVDAWEDGRLVFAALFGSHVLHDRETLLRYLTDAAPVFGESGEWTGRTAGLILAKSIIEHASALANAISWQRNVTDAEPDAAVAQLINEELPAYFAHAWRVLLTRSDGLALAAALHVRLADPRPRPGVYRVDVPSIALRTLSGCLTAIRPRAAQFRTLWRLRREAQERAGRGRHVSGLRAFACMVAITASDEPLDPELFDWLGELLRGDPSDWRYFANCGALPELLDRMVSLLAKNNDPIPKFEALYASLEPSRRRGEFGRTHTENDADLASVVLIVLLAAVLDKRVVRNGEDIVETSSRLFRRALRLYLVSSPAFEPTLSARAALTFTIQVCVRANQAMLEECLGPVLTDPGHAAEVLAALLSSVPRHRLERAVEATYGNLLILQSRSLEWAVATKLQCDRRAVDALAAALRLPPAETPGTP